MNRNGRRIIPLAIAAVCLLAGCGDDGTAPQDPAIRGVVLDSRNQPVEGAVIRLEYRSPMDPPAAKLVQIQFVVGTAGAARAWVTDPCGGEVIRVLLDAEVPAGSFALIWDGRDDQGLFVGSGRYEFHVEIERESVSDVWLMYSDYPADAAPADYRPVAVTDAQGRFSIAQDCLELGTEIVARDESGNIIDTYTIPRRVNLFAMHADLSLGSSGWIDVDPETGGYARIRLAD